MQPNKKKVPHRMLMLITSPKLAEKVEEMFEREALPLLYQMNAEGTASSEMMDILGIGTSDKSIVVSILPKPAADEMLKKMHKNLRLGTVNSGIAFSLILSGANNIVLQVLEKMFQTDSEESKQGDGKKMTESNYSLITIVVNQGYSEEVMNAARDAGARGGTVVHSLQIGKKETLSALGVNVQEEKDMVFVVANNQSKFDIMRAVSEKCGIRTDARGLVVSLPLDSVIGLDED